MTSAYVNGFWMYGIILDLLKKAKKEYEEQKLKEHPKEPENVKKYLEDFSDNKWHEYGQLCLTIKEIERIMERHSNLVEDSLDKNMG